jgi:group I intron endonuclease
MMYLYVLTFANGKQYIGQTKNCKDRLAGHKCDAVTHNLDTLVYKAWRKYGDPKFKVLAIVEDYMIDETEIKAIKVFNTLKPNGYNLANGGNTTLGLKHTPEQCERNRQARLGKRPSEETKAKLSLARLGRFVSEETRLKISNALKGRATCPQTPEVRAKRAASLIGKKHSQETKDRLSVIMTGIRAAKYWKSRGGHDKN